MRLFSALAVLFSLSFLFAQENNSPTVPCGNEPLDLHAVRQKADAGDPEAQYALGMHYAFGLKKQEHLPESVYWFRKSAEQGYAEAEYRLSQAYGSGRGIRENAKAALYWLRKGAHDGDVGARRSY